MQAIDNKKFFYPPGGILIWIIILVELITFAAATVAFSWQGSQSPDLFSSSAKHLDEHLGFANTIILLTSGFFVAEAVRLIKSGNSSKSRLFIWIGIFLGVAFLLIKGIEYSDKIEGGFHLTYDTFFTFYWLLTGFHFLHVVVGIVILTVLNIQMGKGIYSEDNYLDIESGACFWHLCDLIWLLLFPVLYLMNG
jgi:nitric oxide reductase NorE protein